MRHGNIFSTSSHSILSFIFREKVREQPQHGKAPPIPRFSHQVHQKAWLFLLLSLCTFSSLSYERDRTSAAWRGTSFSTVFVSSVRVSIIFLFLSLHSLVSRSCDCERTTRRYFPFSAVVAGYRAFAFLINSALTVKNARVVKRLRFFVLDLINCSTVWTIWMFKKYLLFRAAKVFLSQWSSCLCNTFELLLEFFRFSAETQ